MVTLVKLAINTNNTKKDGKTFRVKKAAGRKLEKEKKQKKEDDKSINSQGDVKPT